MAAPTPGLGTPLKRKGALLGGAVGDAARARAAAKGREYNLEFGPAAGVTGNIAIAIAKAFGIEKGTVGGPTGGTIGGHIPGGQQPEQTAPGKYGPPGRNYPAKAPTRPTTRAFIPGKRTDLGGADAAGTK